MGRRKGPAQEGSLHCEQAALPDDAAADAAVMVVRALLEAGHAAYLVGGCVRDIVRGALPKDYDIATSATPQQVRDAVGKVIEVGAKFGVLRVPCQARGERFEVEVATFRAESGYVDGRRPSQVRFTDAREDVLRRDFTINGLLMGPTDEGWQIADFVGGLEDLRGGRLRAIGKPLQRFEEDHLRVLRMVRFATRFSLAIDPATMAAAFKCASRLRRISAERVRDELMGMLAGPVPEHALKLLGKLKVGALLWAPLLDGDSLARRAGRLARLDEALGTDLPDGGFAPTRDRTPLLALAVLFGPAGSPSPRERARALADALRLSKQQARWLEHVFAAAQALRALPVVPAGASASPAMIRALRAERADDALLLLAAIEPRQAVWPRLRALRAAADVTAWRPELAVTGASLRGRGYRPSPAIRAAIEAGEDAQLRGGGPDDAWSAALTALGGDGPG